MSGFTQGSISSMRRDSGIQGGLPYLAVPEISNSTEPESRHPREEQGGHAIHFLQRLSRASGSQAELALQLYNDPEVLRFVLGSLTIPDEFDRVAVSLHENDSGPYLVATRKGRFVTCLGEGMSIKGLHLINHSRLLNHMEKNEEYRRRKELAHSLVGERHELKKLFVRIAGKGVDVTREEMLAISAMQPALKDFFLRKLFEYMLSIDERTKALIRRKRFTAKDRPVLKKHYGEYWATGHLALLASMSGPAGFPTPIGELGRMIRYGLVIPLFSSEMSMLLRLVWFIGKMGKGLMPELKRMLLEPDMLEEWLLGYLGLIVMGLRHSKTRPAVIKIFNKLPGALDTLCFDVRSYLAKLDLPTIMTMGFMALVKPEVSRERALVSARNLCFSAHERATLPDRYTWEKEEDIPEDMAVTFMANLPLSFRDCHEALMFCLILTPWLARCEMEDFYHPHDYNRFAQAPWKPADTIALIDRERKVRAKNKPVKVEKAPSRNDPCPCGSGKKYKRCCLVRT